MIRIALFASKKDLICVDAGDVRLDKLFKTRWPWSRRDRGFVRAEGDPDNQEHNSERRVAQSAQADLLKVKPRTTLPYASRDRLEISDPR